MLPNTNSSNTAFFDGPDANLDVVELKRLLTDILEKRPDIFIRFRIVGQLWQINFFNITGISEDDVFFFDHRQQSTVRIHIRDIMQIELEGVFQSYRPHFHYTVKLTS